MVLSLHIRSAETNEVVPVKMSKMSKADAMQTNKEPLWQSSWTSEFIYDKEKLKYALKTADGELVALGASKRPATVWRCVPNGAPAPSPAGKSSG